MDDDEVDERTEIEREVNEAIEAAVRNNLGIALARERLAAARYGISLSLGGFEPVLRAAFRGGEDAQILLL